MKELTRTLLFVGLAVVAVAVALLTRPAPTNIKPDEELGQSLFPELKDPLRVARLEIVKIDKGLAKLSRFQVAQVDGVWSIVSQDNYPVEARDRIKDVATLVMGLKPLGVEADGEGDENSHKLYGVVEPDPEKVNVGAEGVGTMLVLKDAEGKDLARLIIGKKAEAEKEGPASSEGEELRYVRRAGQDRVYTVKIDTSSLSTRFEDWIKRDLLQSASFDLKQAQLHDYVRVPGRRVVVGRSLMVLGHDAGKWSLKAGWYVEKGKKTTLSTLPKNEKLNEDALNGLKNALDDLKIAGVERRPASLKSNVVTGATNILDEAGLGSLVEHGFYPQEEGQDGERVVRIYSDNGEVRAGLKNGVEYVIRFGKVSGSGSAPSGKKDGKKDSKAETKVGLERYVLVDARVNEALLDRPALKPLPKKKPPQKPKKDSKGKADEKEAEKKFEEERKRVEQENKSAQKEYDEKVKAAKKKVRELNTRFSEWYFIISEDVYQKVHLTRTDVISKVDPKSKDKKK